MSEESWKFESGIRPAHLVAGLGASDRAMLSTCLALYDDAKLQARLLNIYESSKGVYRKWVGSDLAETVKGVENSQQRWFNSSYGDDQLRILLWIRLRDSLGLPARLSFTWRGCSQLADDITAALINAIDPPGLSKAGKAWLHQKGWLHEGEQALTLQDVVVPILDDFMKASMDEDEVSLDEEKRHQVLEAVIKYYSGLDRVGHESLLKEIRVDTINDRAILKVVLTGATLGGIGVGVSISGFSAYILAAKASASIPMVSGPGLVSLLHVLANPITLIGGTGIVAWWAYSSAKRRANVAVAARVVAMLVIQGLQAKHADKARVLSSFAQMPSVIGAAGFGKSEIDSYCRDWAQCKAVHSKANEMPDSDLLEVLDQPIPAELGQRLGSAEGTTSRQQELQNAVALSTMTLGDIVYSAASVDPTVIAAADFSRLAEIDGTVAFAHLAENLLDGSSWAVQGGINQLKGYVAEKVIAGQLVARGHTVSFPDASNSPGWDIMVDGQPFQVKFHESLAGIRRHFDRYDYPVFANTELADSIPEEFADQVFFVDGVSNELVTHVTEHSLHAADGMLESNVPAMAFLISTARGTMGYSAGTLSGQQAVEHVLLDGTVRVGLATGGGGAGAGIGFLLFGPAGAWVFGAGAPILAQSQTPWAVNKIKGLFTGSKQKAWFADSHDALDSLQRVAIKTISMKRQQFRGKIEAVPTNELGRYMRWRLQDEEQFAAEVETRLESATADQFERPEQRGSELLRLIAIGAIHPASFQGELRAVNEMLSSRPTILAELDDDNRQKYLGKVRKKAEKLWRRLVEKGNEVQNRRTKGEQ